MSYGSNQAVEDAEDQYREQCAQVVAQAAAKQVASGECGRDEAIGKAVEWLRHEQAAGNDPTGTTGVENTYPSAGKEAPSAQVAAITADLLDAARKAVDGF